jgi:hypothetical protein
MNHQAEDGHVPIPVLWEYSKNLNIDILSDGHRRHLGVCEECFSVLGLCRTLPSVKDVEEKLNGR